MHLVRACCDNQVHVKRVECLNLWLKNVGLVIWTWLETFVKSTSITQTLLHFSSIDNDIKTDFTVSCSQSQHLTSVSCSSFSRFSCPWFGPDNKGSDMFKHCIGPRVFTHWSAAFSKRKSRFAMFCEFQKKLCILTTYNISPRQASKEENRKQHWNVWFFNSEKVNFPKLLASSFSTIFKHHWKNLAELGNFFTSYNSSKFSSRTCKTCDIYKAVTPNL